MVSLNIMVGIMTVSRMSWTIKVDEIVHLGKQAQGRERKGRRVRDRGKEKER